MRNPLKQSTKESYAIAAAKGAIVGVALVITSWLALSSKLPAVTPYDWALLAGMGAIICGAAGMMLKWDKPC